MTTDPTPQTAAERQTGGQRVKRGLAEMLRGGVIMDVVNAEQAKIAEDAGAVAVMALERVPADIRRDGGVARMSDPALIQGIQQTVTVPGTTAAETVLRNSQCPCATPSTSAPRRRGRSGNGSRSTSGE